MPEREPSLVAKRQVVPIFIITCDRVTVLRQVIASYVATLDAVIEIVLHDNGSRYQPMLQYLAALEDEGVTVYRTGQRIRTAGQLDSVADSVDDWMARHPQTPHYVVTDPDVALDGSSADMLQMYADVLDSTGIDVIGPMLRIDDLPDHYPLKAEVIKRHTAQFWHKEPRFLQWRGRAIAYQRAAIDTTFGMYRRGYRFHRLSEGYRTYAPYLARHLDWYLDPSSLEEDQRYYLGHASDAAHWSGPWLREKTRGRLALVSARIERWAWVNLRRLTHVGGRGIRVAKRSTRRR